MNLVQTVAFTTLVSLQLIFCLILVQTLAFSTLVPLLLRFVDSGRFEEGLKVKIKRESCMLNEGLDISSGEVKHATARAQVKFNRLHTYTPGIV
jgi:hypothetical protein